MMRQRLFNEGLAVALAVFGLGFSGFSHAADTAPAQKTIAVLTPAAPEKFLIHAGDLLPTESVFDSKKNAKLRSLALASGFSISERLSAQALQALRASGWDAELRSMPRIAVGGPVRRENYPTDTGRLMLDIKVQVIGVLAGSFWGRLGSYTPIVEVKYMVLDAGARPIQPSKNVYYCHSGPSCERAQRVSKLIVADDEPNCAFTNFEAIEKDPARLWGCFDVSFRRISETIAADVKRPGGP
jgi:hypothetical protein